MGKPKEFIKSTLIGGLLVLLPLAIFVYIAIWLFELVRGAIAPLTRLVMARSALQGAVADVVAVGLLVWLCFFVGVLVRTRLGTWLYGLVESRLLRKAPGYSMIKETVAQFLGSRRTPFSSVALVRIFGNDTLASAFVTDTHEDGGYTVFVPTGPNPTSGNIYHLRPENVFPVDTSVEDTMRTIISCGAGSSMLIARFRGAPHPTKKGG
ncbi:DUF502 domain-containing protein [Anaerobaca lacustris]|uniref:DUF502 domain-containing protein n=1 Tax=Anaerobaca lacustris TaxID=3044600 RepID=A0AAW6TTP8_9BACT|nr:DUF502 domain-containing protein [Sedimentisphaerales bacterium M17dextr]